MIVVIAAALSSDDDAVADSVRCGWRRVISVVVVWTNSVTYVLPVPVGVVVLNQYYYFY